MSEDPLSTEISELTIGSLRESLSVAFALDNQSAPEDVRVDIAKALSKASPVDVACGVLSVMMHQDLSAFSSAFLARCAELGALIAEHNFHGMADQALGFSEDCRSEIAGQ